MQNGLKRLIKTDDMFKLNKSEIKERMPFLKGISNLQIISGLFRSKLPVEKEPQNLN